jgi:hypothetical protein
MLPRKANDFANNDDVHKEIENQKLDQAFPLDSERRPRSSEVMAEEAMFLRSIFPENCPTFEES